ncbi:hypothetical protein ABZ543_13365 [Streptomyces roseifaciens]
MKLLITAKEPYRNSDTDFSWTEVGEILMPDPGREHFVGISTGRYATIAVVANVDITREAVKEQVFQRFTQAGWHDPSRKKPMVHTRRQMTTVFGTAHGYPVGTHLTLVDCAITVVPTTQEPTT